MLRTMIQSAVAALAFMMLAGAPLVAIAQQPCRCVAPTKSPCHCADCLEKREVGSDASTEFTTPPANIAPNFAPNTPAPAPVSANAGPSGALLGGGTQLAQSTNDAPNMIGDSVGGGCAGILIGGVVVADLEHPSYACSRINIAENNSPIARDRLYYSYRHFHNATNLDVFSYSPQGGAASIDLDRHIFGLEHLITDGLSIECRLPINVQLSSDIRFLQTDTTVLDGSNNNLEDIFQNRQTELGNIDIILKQALYSSESCYVSAGVGLNLPTAPDINFFGRIDDDNFPLFDPNVPGPPTFETVGLDIRARYKNETINLAPFLAWVYAPQEACWFSQGFAQMVIPLNAAQGTFVAQAFDPVTDNYEPPVEFQGELSQQTLLRLNLGGGVYLHRGNGFLTSIAAVTELHFTTTLSDSDVESFTAFTANQFAAGLPPEDLNLAFGQLQSNSQNLNLVFGLPVTLGKTTIYNGCTVPLLDSPDRGFDFEYSVSLDRRF